MLADTLMLLLLFGLAGGTSVGFYYGRRKNIELMIRYVRELEDALKPLDKEYTLLGLYSGFRAEYLIEHDKVEKVEASLGLMPRLSVLYYPISLLTLRHDRLYLVFRLKKKPTTLHILSPKVLSFKGIDVDIKKQLKEIESSIGKLLTYYEDENVYEKFLKFVERNPNVLHVALTPETKVLYVFMKPKPGIVKKVVSESLSLIEETV